MNTRDHKGVPVAIVEAINYDIPVIARDVGGNREIVHHSENGLLLRSNPEVNELASAISFFIDLCGSEINEHTVVGISHLMDERIIANQLSPRFS